MKDVDNSNDNYLFSCPASEAIAALTAETFPQNALIAMGASRPRGRLVMVEDMSGMMGGMGGSNQFCGDGGGGGNRKEYEYW